jgi:uncharacterized repeat protein (TIGR03803 family)
MMRVRGRRWVWGLVVFCVEVASASHAQTFTTLLRFDGTDGKYARAALIQGADGNLYGTTTEGGHSRHGNAFSLTPSGQLTAQHDFCMLVGCADGDDPIDSLTLAGNAKFYGTTSSGGALGPTGCGTVFEGTASGTVATLYSFEGPDGCNPSGLVQAANGNFYGTTSNGGLNGGGVVFEISASGTFTTLYNFCSLPNCVDGAVPFASLIQGTDGNLYGTTVAGGANQNAKYCNGCGTVFKITAAGKLTTMHSFCSLANCTDGIGPYGSLVQATDGNFYGTTSAGGKHDRGTIFRIIPNGTLAGLYHFCTLPACADGRSPQSSLIQASDGNFYGTTQLGGDSGYGTAFEITPAGALTVLHNFCPANCADGSYAYGSLLQATDGKFYGTTSQGGTGNYGTVFSLDTGLAPFVSFIRNPAKIGQQFGILGYGLSGTSSVVFNGTSANFTAKSDTLLIATVPAGATTGYVTVTTPSDALTSNVPFRVIP